MQKISKAVILMAGKGTRMLPATKVCPKELFPIGNVPALLYILKECLDSGIKEVCLVISKEKKAVKKFFKIDKEIEKLSINNEGLKLLIEVSKNLKISFVYQGKMKGTGGATYYARKFTKNEPFLLLSGDDLFISNAVPASKEIIDEYLKHSGYVVGCKRVEEDKVGRYGIIKPKVNKNDILVAAVVEKPRKGENPSNLALLSRYILIPEVFKNIKKLAKNENQEIKLPDAVLLNRNKEVFAKEISAVYYDLGNQVEFIKCVVELGLNSKEMSSNIDEYLENQREKDGWANN